MINQNFGILAAVIALLGSIDYARETLRGNARPDLVTWLLWMIAPAITFAAELASHAPLLVTLLTFAEGFGPLLVLTASFKSSYAYWKPTRFDALCGLLSIGTLIIWAVTGQSVIAIIFGILSSLAATLPTGIKAYAHPATESPWDYVFSTAAALLTLLTIRHWMLASYGFPVYLFASSLTLSALVLLPRGKQVEYTDVTRMLDIGEITFSQNPIVAGSATIMSVSLGNNTEPAAMEYYIGDNDPGAGQGMRMTEYNQDIFVAAVGANLNPGEYAVTVRAKDPTGNWGTMRASELVVLPYVNIMSAVPEATPNSGSAPSSGTVAVGGQYISAYPCTK